MNFSRIIVKVLLFALSFSVIYAQTELKPRLGEPPLRNESYIFIDGKTADHIIKKAFEKRMGFAFELKDESGEWIKRNLESIVKNNPIVFISSNISKQQAKYLDELAKLSDYTLKIICFKGDCEKNEKWKHPLIKAHFFIKWQKTGKKEEPVLTGLNRISKGEDNSVQAVKNFRKNPFIVSSVFFKEHRFAFVLLEENERPEFLGNADTVIYFSKSEKKLKEFIEKKI